MRPPSDPVPSRCDENPDPVDRDEITGIVGELALGLLDGKEEREALDLIATDPAALAEYEFWRRHLSNLREDGPPVPGSEREGARRSGRAAPFASRSGGFKRVAATVLCLAGMIAALLLVVLIVLV